MAAFLRRSRTHLVSAPGKLLSWCEQPRSRGSLSAGSLLRSSEAIGGWRGSGGVPFSSWTGGAGAWRYHSYQRPRLAEWGDWACVGLTALAGGLYWTSWTPSKETLAEKLLNVVVVYEALSYSLKRKVLRLRLKWFRHKLVLKGAVLKELERKNEEHLGEVASIVQEIEDAIFHKMGKVSDKVHIDSGDPFLTSAYIMLRRIYRIREFVSRKPKGSSSGDSSVRTDFDSQRTEGFLVQLSKLEEMVRMIVKAHAYCDVHITRNKELVARVDALLLSLEKET